MTVQTNKMLAQLTDLIQTAGLSYLTIEENFLLNLADQWQEVIDNRLVDGSTAGDLYWQAIGQWWRGIMQTPALVSQMTPFEDADQMAMNANETSKVINQAMRLVESWVQTNEGNAFISSGKIIQLMLQRLADFQLIGQSQEELQYIGSFWQAVATVWSDQKLGEN